MNKLVRIKSAFDECSSNIDIVPALAEADEPAFYSGYLVGSIGALIIWVLVWLVVYQLCLIFL